MFHEKKNGLRHNFYSYRLKVKDQNVLSANYIVLWNFVHIKAALQPLELSLFPYFNPLCMFFNKLFCQPYICFRETCLKSCLTTTTPDSPMEDFREIPS